MIVCGLYCVLWGKDKEIKKVSQLVPDIEAIDITSSSSFKGSRQGGKGSSHGGNSKLREENDEQQEEEKRDSQVGSEILGGVYIYH